MNFVLFFKSKINFLILRYFRFFIKSETQDERKEIRIFKNVCFNRHNYSGSTLLEMLVVCALFATIATLSIGASRLFHRFAAQTELEHLYMACRYMQRRAMCTHQEQRLIIDIPQRTYTYAERKHALSASVVFGTTSGVKGPPANPTDVVARPVTFPNNTIIFYPTGIISSGAVYITDRSHTCCYALSNAVSSVSFLRRYVHRKTWQLIE